MYPLRNEGTDQNGKKQKLSALAGRPRLAARVFTICQTACPLLVRELQSIESRLSPEVRARMAVDLFSFDSKRETPSSLKKFLEKYKVDPSRWSAHAAAAGFVAELAAALGIQYKALPSGEFIHANVSFLVDEKGELRGKKEGLSADDGEFLARIRKLGDRF